MSRYSYRTLLPLILLLSALGSGCATQQPWPQPQSHCESADILLDAHFAGGNLGQCTVLPGDRFELALIPEDEPPINPSPWYAFRISGKPGDEVTVRMAHEHGHARYWPKVSDDGQAWHRLEEDRVVVDGDREWMEIRLPLEQANLWVAGQELTTDDYYVSFLDDLSGHEDVTTHLIGTSVEGRPIVLAEAGDEAEIILMIGRQHPPEVTGAFAMRTFMATVFGDTELARAFRARFKLAIVPQMNPDGVAGGHWRHNANGVDINRDWGPFTQPETRAVIRWLEGQEAQGRKLSLMLDFHSTWEDLFYTQPVTENPPDYASVWLGASAERLPDFPFKHEANPVSEQPNAKNYFYMSRGIPAITYEVGDETDRDAIRSAAVVFAEEMMRTMLETPRG